MNEKKKNILLFGEKITNGLIIIIDSELLIERVKNLMLYYVF